MEQAEIDAAYAAWGEALRKYGYHDEGSIELEIDEGTPLILYGDVMFIRQCPHCARFVKADESIGVREEFGPVDEPNATCSKHGRVKMPFEGYID